MGLMSREPTKQRMAAWRAFLETHKRMMETLSRELDEERQLPLVWYDVLAQLHDSDAGHLRMSELADAVVLSRSGITRLVDRMVGAGLVRRTHCPTDRRGTNVELTDEGRRAFKDAAPVHRRGIDEHFTQFLTDDEAATLQEALERVLRAVGE